jgi:hypothetical protein
MALSVSGTFALRSQRADTSTSLPSVHLEGGGIMASFQDVILLLDLIVNTITLVVLIYAQKK